jgi:hypothetical protein
LEDGDIFRIKAEKFTIGISVTRPLRWGGDVVPRCVCENLEDCGEIRMEDLLAILTEPSPDYHLLSDNCWSYADATFKQVIRKFSETPSLSPERRSYLASFLNMPSPSPLPCQTRYCVPSAPLPSAQLSWLLLLCPHKMVYTRLQQLKPMSHRYSVLCRRIGVVYTRFQQLKLSRLH